MSELIQRTSTAATGAAPTIPEPKPRFQQLKDVWHSLALDWRTVAMAVKTSIPPTVLVCAIQSNTWIHYFKANSYLVPIIATCVLPALSRAMLLEYNLQLAFALVLSYCWVLLAGWAGLQARKHTTQSAAELAMYNSSAEAVAAIFLMFFMWFAFTFKSKFPKWNLQCVLAGIFVVAVLPPVAMAPNMTQILSESNNALASFLAGQAVGLVNALVVFPQSSRGILRVDTKTCLESLMALMRAQRDCTDAMRHGYTLPEDDASSPVGVLRERLQQFLNTVVKIRSGVEYAKREIAWSRLNHAQLERLIFLLADLIPPATGLSAVADMHEIVFAGTVAETDDDEDVEVGQTATAETWHGVQQSMHECSNRQLDAILEGSVHAMKRLGLKPSSAHPKSGDEENQRFGLNPGQASFLEAYRHVFANCPTLTMEHEKAPKRDPHLEEYLRHRPRVDNPEDVTHEKYVDNLRYVILLHSHTLLSSLGEELMKLLVFVEECHTRPNRIVWPHFGYFIKAAFDLRDPGKNALEPNSDSIVDENLRQSFRTQKNPDHLPPASFAERVGDSIRKISVVCRSEHAAYGLRGMCAIMTVAITAFLRSSQHFFLEQRLLWALFAILLSMGRTSGSSTFLLLGRIFGTATSMTASYLIWYVADQKVPGILVFTWVWFTILGYLFVKFPKFTGVWFVSLIAAIVMVGNELQIQQMKKLGIPIVNQADYAPYIIFPYRLAVVAWGVVTGYFWTLFPYPLSEHSELRQEMAKAMYILANYSICVHQSVAASLHGKGGDFDDPSSLAFHLQATRRRIFRKFQALTLNASGYFRFLDWEFSLGGRFPRKSYQEILATLQRIGNYMTATNYASLSLDPIPSGSPQWNSDGRGGALEHVLPSGVTTRMVILHSALGLGHPLPPELEELTIPNLSEFLKRGIAANEGFATIALIRSVNWFTVRDVNRLTELVRDLVGEFHSSFTIDEEVQA